MDGQGHSQTLFISLSNTLDVSEKYIEETVLRNVSFVSSFLIAKCQLK